MLYLLGFHGVGMMNQKQIMRNHTKMTIIGFVLLSIQIYTYFSAEMDICQKLSDNQIVNHLRCVLMDGPSHEPGIICSVTFSISHDVGAVAGIVLDQ